VDEETAGRTTRRLVAIKRQKPNLISYDMRERASRRADAATTTTDYTIAETDEATIAYTNGRAHAFRRVAVLF